MEIIDFEDKYEEDFRNLNLEWLYKYNLAESHDLEVLSDPQGTIIKPGGCIFLARENDSIAGCAGLMKMSDGVYELVKMAVADSFRGKGISKVLLTCCIDKAKKLGAKKLILFSNHQLETALHLYKQFGFTNIPVEDSPFETADVKMELILHAE